MVYTTSTAVAAANVAFVVVVAAVAVVVAVVFVPDFPCITTTHLLTLTGTQNALTLVSTFCSAVYNNQTAVAL